MDIEKPLIRKDALTSIISTLSRMYDFAPTDEVINECFERIEKNRPLLPQDRREYIVDTLDEVLTPLKGTANGAQAQRPTVS